MGLFWRCVEKVSPSPGVLCSQAVAHQGSEKPPQRTASDGFADESGAAHKGTGSELPEPGQGDSQTSEGNGGLLHAGSGAVAAKRDHSVTGRTCGFAHQFHEKGIRQGHQRQQFLATFPVVDP